MSVIGRGREAWDALFQHNNLSITDALGNVQLAKLTTRQGVLLLVQMGPRLLTKMVALDDRMTALLGATENLHTQIRDLHAQVQEAQASMASDASSVTEDEG